MLIMLILALFLSPGAAPGPTPSPVDADVAAVVVDESDDASTVRLDIGQQFVVEVEENPTTPYSWSVLRAPDDAVLRTLDDEYETGPGCEDGQTGCGGAHTYEFRATAAGTTRLTLAQGRGGDEPPSTTLDLRVVIEQ